MSMRLAADPRALYDAGLYTETLSILRSLEQQRALLNDEQVLLADVPWCRGDVDAAYRVAHRLLQERGLSVRQRCALRGTIGQCHFTRGNSSKAADEFHIGIELAQQSNEPFLECRLRLDLFLNQIRWLGPQHAVAVVDDLRRRIHQLGDPATTIGFQLGMTELAAKLALLPRARQHLQTARALLPRVGSNRALIARFKHDEVALFAVEGDVVAALEKGLPLGESEDLASNRGHLTILLSHLLIMQGRFEEAALRLERALAAPNIVGGAAVALLDTMMLLKLSEGKLAEAEAWDADIRRMLGETELKGSYFGVSYMVTRVRLLYRLGRVADGLAEAVGALAEIERMADRNLFARIKLLIAEGLGLTGRPLEGVSAIAEVFDSNPELSLEIVAETFRVAGGLICYEDLDAARGHFDRAEQVWRALGNLTGAAAVDRERRDRSIATRDAGRSPVQWDERIAALLEMGMNPALLASQAIDVIADTGSALRAAIVESDSTGPPRAVAFHPPANRDAGILNAPGAIRIDLGLHRDRRYEVYALPLPGAAARVRLRTIKRIVGTAVEVAQSRMSERERAALWPTQSAEQQLGLICSSERTLGLVKNIHRVAATNITVLLTGETDVGKELFARALHQASARSDRLFLPFNCSTVPRDMLDSQLFGHKRGAFTGAQNDAPGMIRAAAGGTLFLDEIGEMAIETQPKLLRFLESGEILALGEPKPQLVDVRIVAATNANLDQLVADGRFREDLYYRLNVIRIDIPPLRERREEIPALVEHFVDRFGRELQKPMLRLANETLEYLVLYRWPGNVRQLANEIRRLVAMAEPGAVLMPAHLSDDIAASRRTVPANASPRLFNEVIARIDQPLSAVVEHVERAAIQRALSMTEGRLDEAAKMLGLSRKGLYLKRQRLNLG